MRRGATTTTTTTPERYNDATASGLTPQQSLSAVSSFFFLASYSCTYFISSTDATMMSGPLSLSSSLRLSSLCCNCSCTPASGALRGAAALLLSFSPSRLHGSYYWPSSTPAGPPSRTVTEPFFASCNSSTSLHSLNRTPCDAAENLLAVRVSEAAVAVGPGTQHVADSLQQACCAPASPPEPLISRPAAAIFGALMRVAASSALTAAVDIIRIVDAMPRACSAKRQAK